MSLCLKMDARTRTNNSTIFSHWPAHCWHSIPGSCNTHWLSTWFIGVALYFNQGLSFLAWKIFRLFHDFPSQKWQSMELKWLTHICAYENLPLSVTSLQGCHFKLLFFPSLLVLNLFSSSKLHLLDLLKDFLFVSPLNLDFSSVGKPQSMLQYICWGS